MEVDQIRETLPGRTAAPANCRSMGGAGERGLCRTENKGVINLSDWIFSRGVAAAWNLPSPGLWNVDALGAI